MEKRRALFSDYKTCTSCKKYLPDEYEFEMCPLCIENSLFREVREFIRANDVTEHDVAKEFSIPVSRVRAWIREGRIQYKEDKNKRVIGHHCGRCGVIIMRGEFCTSCKYILKHQKRTAVFNPEELEDLRMRYYNTEDQ